MAKFGGMLARVGLLGTPLALCLALDAGTAAFKIFQNSSIDLVRGRAEAIIVLDGDGTEQNGHIRGKRFAFWLQVEGKQHFFAPMNGTLFYVGSATEMDKSICQSASYRKGRARVDSLAAGTQLCAKLQTGQYAAIKIERSDPAAARYLIRTKLLD